MKDKKQKGLGFTTDDMSVVDEETATLLKNRNLVFQRLLFSKGIEIQKAKVKVKIKPRGEN